MSREMNDFATWFYRGTIGIALSVIFFFCKSNYDDFREMKMDVVNIKQSYAESKEADKSFDKRLSNIESVLR